MGWACASPLTRLRVLCAGQHDNMSEFGVGHPIPCIGVETLRKVYLIERAAQGTLDVDNAPLTFVYYDGAFSFEYIHAAQDSHRPCAPRFRPGRDEVQPLCLR